MEHHAANHATNTATYTATYNASHTASYNARIDGTDLSFSAPADMPLLQAAELAMMPDLKMESSCRNGTCRTCICQLLQGQVAYRIDWPGLSLDEKREGFILPCVAYPMSDVMLVLPI